MTQDDGWFEVVLLFLAKPMRKRAYRWLVMTLILVSWILGGVYDINTWIVTGFSGALLLMVFARFLTWVYEDPDAEGRLPFPDTWDDMTWGEKIWYRDNMRLAGWELEGEDLPEEKIYGNPYGPGYVMYKIRREWDQWGVYYPGGLVEVRINGGKPISQESLIRWADKLKSEKDRQKVAKIMMDTGRDADDVIEEIVRNNKIQADAVRKARQDACEHAGIESAGLGSQRLLCKDCGMTFKNMAEWHKHLQARIEKEEAA